MNKIVYFVITIMLFSCKSNSIAQEKVQKADLKPKAVQKPISTSLQNLQSVEPGTIKFIASIESLNKDNMICGISYKITTLVKINRIINSGQGIVNILSPGQEVTLAFMNSKNSSTDYNILQKKFAKGNQISIQVREGLCLDMSQTVYTIADYRVVD